MTEKLIRCSKLIDDPGSTEIMPLWSSQDYFAMDASFCTAMQRAVKSGEERAREPKWNSEAAGLDDAGESS